MYIKKPECFKSFYLQLILIQLIILHWILWPDFWTWWSTLKIENFRDLPQYIKYYY